jgi:hypothetical protein
MRVPAEVTPVRFTTSIEQDAKTAARTCYSTKRIVAELATLLAVEEQPDAIGREAGGHIDGFRSFGNADEKTDA